MSQATPPVRRLTFSDAVRDTFEPLFANFWTLAILALLIVGAPYAVLTGIAGPPSIAARAGGDPVRAALFGFGQIANGTVQMFASAFLQGAAAVVLVRQLSGGKAGWRGALRAAGRSAGALILIALITVVAAFLAIVVAFVPGVALMVASKVAGAIGLVAGFLALFVVGGVLLAGWTASAPAAAVERLGPIAALGRSWRLSKGSRWTVFWVMLLVALIGGVVSALVALPASLLLGVTVAMGGGPGLFWPLIAILQAVGAAAGALLYAAAPGAIYWNLRRAKEGAGPAELAAVFD